jgi:3-methyl-2-oxobutanoate hydroxymethyltransferase
MSLSADEVRARKGGARLAMLTAYDHPTAAALDRCGLDLILVGDSMGEVELGYDTTRAVTLAMMEHHVRAVRNGVAETHLVADLPADTYRDPAEAVASSRALVAAGAESVKLEGAHVAEVEAIIAAGIPVMGHVGLLPQTATSYRRHGTEPEEAERIVEDARQLDDAGVYAIVIEATDHDVARRVTEAVRAPTIGIAAGAATDGQVLVVSDLIGLTPEPPPFVTPLATVFADIVRAGTGWAAAVKDATAGAGAERD